MKDKKAKFNLYLPMKETEEVRENLKARNLTLSGFLSMILVEYAKEIRGHETLLNKPLEEMTVKEAMDYINFWARRIKEINEE